jgi:hypothetical protein
VSERAKLAVQDEYGGVLGFTVAGDLRGRRRRVRFIDADAASESAPRPRGTSSRLNGLDFVWVTLAQVQTTGLPRVFL